MPKIEKKWFIIDSAVGPIYLEPNFHSSCLSEAVYGESCEILVKQDNWLEIKCEDGYRGWINSFYGYISNEKNKPSYIVAYPSKSGFFSSKYPFGSMVTEPVKGSILISEKLGFNHIIEIAENLLGIPYRWGGKTSMGFDCSGLVQSVLKLCGLVIPRDSKDQRLFLKNEQIDLFDAEPGDLHFFGVKNKVTHVGFSTKAAGILHSQGSVKIETIDPSNIKHNKNLLDIYLSTHSIRRKFSQ